MFRCIGPRCRVCSFLLYEANPDRSARAAATVDAPPSSNPSRNLDCSFPSLSLSFWILLAEPFKILRQHSLSLSSSFPTPPQCSPQGLAGGLAQLPSLPQQPVGARASTSACDCYMGPQQRHNLTIWAHWQIVDRQRSGQCCLCKRQLLPMLWATNAALKYSLTSTPKASVTSPAASISVPGKCCA